MNIWNPFIADEKASEETKWPGNWFPKAPGAPDPVLAPKKATPRPQPHFNRDGKWTGNWFPNKPQIEEETGRGREGMTGEMAHEKFHEINNEITDTMDEGGSVKKQLNMGSLDPQCDDTKVCFDFLSSRSTIDSNPQMISTDELIVGLWSGIASIALHLRRRSFSIQSEQKHSANFAPIRYSHWIFCK